MEKILMICAGADNAKAISFAANFAQLYHKTLVVARVGVAWSAHFAHQMQLAGPAEDIATDSRLTAPEIIDLFLYTEQDIATYARQENFTMVMAKPGNIKLNLQTLLNKLHCPLMLLPVIDMAPTTNRIVYLTDLRYCQQQVLAHLSGFEGSSLLLAHICQGGLPDLSENYSDQLFSAAAAQRLYKSNLFFSHIREQHMPTIAETLIDTMQADVIVLMNRRFHFRQLLSDQIPAQMPKYISVPLLIFPC